ncbi:porin family protein [Larkinella soli]|uniref:porin family protein n=1 Tax=Larkinella soli TaxID=1770527 RepID=UPI000FFC2E78|nr:porin family protein [Larkinella soli]
MKNLCFLILFILFSLSAFSQVRVGIRVGVHWSTVLNEKLYTGRQLAPGGLVAIPFQLPLSDRWGLRAEPTFVQKGWKTRIKIVNANGVSSETGHLVQRHEVIELPVLVTYRKELSSRLAVFGLLGPSVGYVVGGRLKVISKNAPDVNDKLIFERRIDTGLWAGGGLEFPVAGIPAFVDVRYHYGLSAYPNFKVYDTKPTSTGFSVSVGCWPFAGK